MSQRDRVDADDRRGRAPGTRPATLGLWIATVVTFGGPAMAAAAWTEQGPAPNVVPTAGFTEVSGAVEVISPDPSDPNRVFVAAASGGVWRTTNATAARPTWVPLTDDQPSLSMGALAFDPLDPTYNTLWAGFGPTTRGFQHNGTHHGPLPGVLIKTTDGGSSWTSLPVPAFTSMWIRKILPITLMTPSGQVVLVATERGQGILPGVYRSADGGLSWTHVLGDGDAFDLVADPSVPARVFAARQDGVHRSDDGGQGWIDASAGLTGVSPGSAHVIHLAMSPTADARGRHWLFAAVHGLGIFWSNDSGSTWTGMDRPFPDGSRAGGTYEGSTQLTVSPLGPTVVFAAGDGGSWWRGDALAAPGSQWFSLVGTNSGGTAPHTDSRHWVFGADPDVLFEADDGGLYRLKGAHGPSPRWESAIGNLQVTEFLSIAYDSVNRVVFGACWDNSIPRQTTSNDTVWRVNERFLGDGIQVGTDNGTPGVSVHYSSQQLLFGAQRSLVTAMGTMTTDLGLDIDIGGDRFLHYNGFEGNLDITNPDDLGTVRFAQTWSVNAVDGRRLLVGTDYLYESFDRGDHFTSLGGVGVNSNGDPIPLNPVGTVTAYTYGHPLDPHLFWVGTFGNGGGHSLWMRRGHTGYPSAMDTYPGGVPFDIAVDPADPARAYVLDHTAHVWRTVDGGLSTAGWTDVTGSLGSLTTDLRTIEVVAPPASASTPAIVVGGQGGIFTGRDADVVVWRRVGDSFPNVVVTDVHYDAVADLLVAGTYGRGAWTFPAARADLFAGPSACLLDVDGRDGAQVATDVVYIARHLLGLVPVPPSFRVIDPTIPPDGTIAASIDAVGAALDVDGRSGVAVSTDVVYIARRLLGLGPVPPSFRVIDPTIPSDATVGAAVDGLCP